MRPLAAIAFVVAAAACSSEPVRQPSAVRTRPITVATLAADPCSTLFGTAEASYDSGDLDQAAETLARWGTECVASAPPVTARDLDRCETMLERHLEQVERSPQTVVDLRAEVDADFGDEAHRAYKEMKQAKVRVDIARRGVINVGLFAS